MLPRIKPAQYYSMPHITPLYSRFIMTMMKRETTGLIIPFPTEKSISGCLHPLQKRLPGPWEGQSRKLPQVAAASLIPGSLGPQTQGADPSGTEKSRPKVTLLCDLRDYPSLWSRLAASPLHGTLRFSGSHPPVQPQGLKTSRVGI